MLSAVVRAASGLAPVRCTSALASQSFSVWLVSRWAYCSTISASRAATGWAEGALFGVLGVDAVAMAFSKSLGLGFELTRATTTDSVVAGLDRRACATFYVAIFSNLKCCCSGGFKRNSIKIFRLFGL